MRVMYDPPMNTPDANLDEIATSANLVVYSAADEPTNDLVGRVAEIDEELERHKVSDNHETGSGRMGLEVERGVLRAILVGRIGSGPLAHALTEARDRSV